MAAPPSSANAGAAVAAMALAGVVSDLARTLPASTATKQASLTACRQVAQMQAPRITANAQVAAIASTLVGLVQNLARATEAGDAATGLYATAAATRVCAPSSNSPALTREYGLARALCLSVEIAALGEAFLAEARTGFADRQSASAARLRIRTAYDGVSDRVSATFGQAVLLILDTAARETSAYLVQEAASLQPVVRVTAARSFPAASLAWSLYGDPQRAGELMSRNACGTPFFMPATIEAVSPEGA